MYTYEKILNDYEKNRIAFLGVSLESYVNTLIESAYKEKKYSKAEKLDGILLEIEDDIYNYHSLDTTTEFDMSGSDSGL